MAYYEKLQKFTNFSFFAKASVFHLVKFCLEHKRLKNSGSFRMMVDGLLLNHWKMIIRGTENYRAWTQLLPLIIQKLVIRVKYVYFLHTYSFIDRFLLI